MSKKKKKSFEDKVTTRKELKEEVGGADALISKLYSMGYTNQFKPENTVPFELRKPNDPWDTGVLGKQLGYYAVEPPEPYSLAEDFNRLDKEIFREKEGSNMINELQITGTQKFMGVEVPVIEGGFGEGQRCVLVKDVAKIHGTTIKRINEVIKNNIDEFDEGVDLLEILGVVSNDPQIGLDLGFSQDSLNSLIGQKGKIYLLSESGYVTLSMLMRTDKAKEIRKQFKREYFAMRATLATQSEYIKVLEERNKALDERNKALEELDKLNACCNIPKSALKKDIKCFMNSLTKEVIFTKVGRKELYEAYRASRRNRPAQPPMSEFEDILFKLNYMQEGDYWLDVVILEDKIRR